MQLSYTATNKKTGRRISGITSAESVSALAKRLNSEGKLPLTIREATSFQLLQAKHKRHLQLGRVSSKELAIFTRQLAATLSAGLLLSDALVTVVEDMDNAYFEKVISNIRENVLAGTSLSMAMSRYPNVFPRAYMSVIRTGEMTGQLYITLGNLAKFLENYERMKQKASSAVHYPLFVFAFACFIVTGMVLFIVPMFKVTFDQAGIELPWLTRAIVSVSDFIIANVVLIAIDIFLFIVILLSLRRVAVINYGIDLLKMKIPFLGKNIIHKSIVSRFCQTLGFLLSAGVPVAASLEIAGQVVDNQPVERAVRHIRSRVLAGWALSDAIKEHNIFPLFVTKMALIGEKTGSTPSMLNKTSEYYDDELENTIQSLVSFIEPALIIFTGVIVAIFVAALYLPIFKLTLLVL